MIQNQREHSPAEHQKAVVSSEREIIQNLIWFLLVAAALTLLVHFIGFTNLQEKIAEAGIFAPLLIILLKASTIIFAPIGGAPLYPIAGAAFGFEKGFIFIFLGNIIGATVSFHISRFFGQKAAGRLLSKPGLQIANEIIQHLGTTSGLIKAHIMFIGFPEAVSYAAGLAPISFRKFMLIHTGMIVIPTALLTFFGEKLIGVSDNLLIVMSVLSAGAAFIGIFFFWLFRKLKK